METVGSYQGKLRTAVLLLLSCYALVRPVPNYSRFFFPAFGYSFFISPLRPAPYAYCHSSKEEPFQLQAFSLRGVETKYLEPAGGTGFQNITHRYLQFLACFPKSQYSTSCATRKPLFCPNKAVKVQASGGKVVTRVIQLVHLFFVLHSQT